MSFGFALGMCFDFMGDTVLSAPAAPVNTVAPATSGIQTQGQTLTVSNGTWTAVPTPTFTYQWNRAAVPISAATAQTYVLQAADVDQAITCSVTATNTQGAVSADSNTVTPAATLTISGAPGLAATVGLSYSFTPTTAGGHAPKTFSIAAKPTWAAFSTATGQLTGTPSAPETDTGIVITVTDNDALTASLASFTITVSNPPSHNAHLVFNASGVTGALASLGVY